MSYRVAVIGTGNPDRSNSYAMAYRHARGYQRLENVELIGCADIIRENAVAFADTFDIEHDGVFKNYKLLLTEIKPDIVSVCTPPKTHAEIVITCAKSDVEAVHCEKPMGGTWSECREMVAVCDREGVQLTFNHQRRFAAPYTKAKSLQRDGRIGDLQRLEIGGHNLYDYGTHLFDICGYITDQTPVKWVIAQVNYDNTEMLYGLPQEQEALAKWRYESGIDGFASTGEDGLVHCQLRLVGDDGTIEVGHKEGPPLRVRTDGSGWKKIDTGRDGIWRAQEHPLDRVLERIPVGSRWSFSDPTYVDRAIEHVVEALREKYEPELAGRNALQGTEIIFACWESARQSGRITLPIEIEGNPLQSLVENKTNQPYS